MKSKDVKEEEVARIPIAFAMVKVMQTLPPDIMEVNLPGYAHWMLDVVFLNLFIVCLRSYLINGTK